MTTPLVKCKDKQDDHLNEFNQSIQIIEETCSENALAKGGTGSEHAAENLGLPARFHILRTLGQGGMGTVYLADDNELKCQLAIKILNPETVPDAHALERFEIEADAASALSHPHIAQVYSFSKDSHTPHIVMEYVNGISFDQVLKRERIIEQERLLNMVLQICDALEYAHLHQVVHRDLKPSNIILQSEGDLVKIVDFGIAKVEPRNKSATQLTQKTDVIGSPMYMSPEQAAAGAVDHRSDLYSLGCIIFEALSGKPLFHADNAIQILLQHINASPRPLTRKLLKKGYSRSLVAILEKLLEKNPAHRYQSASELAEDIRRILNGKVSNALLKKPLLIDISPRVAIAALATTCVLGLAASCIYSTLAISNIERNAKNRVYDSLMSKQSEAKELISKIETGNRDEVSLAARALYDLLIPSARQYYQGDPDMGGRRELLKLADQKTILKAYPAADDQTKIELAKIIGLANTPAPESFTLACKMCRSGDKELGRLGSDMLSKWAEKATPEQQLELSGALSYAFLAKVMKADKNSLDDPFRHHISSGAYRGFEAISNYSDEAIANLRKAASLVPEDHDNTRGYAIHGSYPLVAVSVKKNVYYPELLCLLKSQNTMNIASEGLCKLGPKASAAAPALCKMLDSTDSQLRRSTCRILAAIGPSVASEAVPALARALDRHRHFELEDVAAALAKMGPAGIAVLEGKSKLPLKPAHLDLGENAVIMAAKDALLNLKQ